MSGSGGNVDYWDLKRNTQVKHDILSGYLERWASILSGRRTKTHTNLHYVDGFAGRGRYREGEPGSPLIAMEIGQEMHEHRGGSLDLYCYNVEENADNFKSLKREVDAVRSLYSSVEVLNFPGSFQDYADRILGEISADEDTFVFIDPFGYRGVELEQVLKFLQRRRSEVFVTFMSRYIGRFMRDSNREAAMTAVFGTDEWKKLAEIPAASQQSGAVELYGKQLQEKVAEMGKDLYILPIDVSFEDTKADIYHLIHASQHPKGRMTMELAADRAKRLSAQENLFYDPQVPIYALEALRDAPSGRMTARDLAGKIWLRSWYPSWRKDIKEAIRELEVGGEVTVRAHDGRNRKTGIEERDVVVLNGGRH